MKTPVVDLSAVKQNLGGLEGPLLPSIKREGKFGEVSEPQSIRSLIKVKRRGNDLLPQRRILKRKRSNILKTEKDTLNVDVIADSVKIPFASFVDQKMIKD